MGASETSQFVSVCPLLIIYGHMVGVRSKLRLLHLVPSDVGDRVLLNKKKSVSWVNILSPYLFFRELGTSLSRQKEAKCSLDTLLVYKAIIGWSGWANCAVSALQEGILLVVLPSVL